MSSSNQAPEPTMDQILASIRRIISEDDAPAQAAPGAVPVPQSGAVHHTEQVAEPANFQAPTPVAPAEPQMAQTEPQMPPVAHNTEPQMPYDAASLQAAPTEQVVQNDVFDLTEDFVAPPAVPAQQVEVASQPAPAFPTAAIEPATPAAPTPAMPPAAQEEADTHGDAHRPGFPASDPLFGRPESNEPVAQEMAQPQPAIAPEMPAAAAPSAPQTAPGSDIPQAEPGLAHVPETQPEYDPAAFAQADGSESADELSSFAKMIGFMPQKRKAGGSEQNDVVGAIAPAEAERQDHARPTEPDINAGLFSRASAEPGSLSAPEPQVQDVLVAETAAPVADTAAAVMPTETQVLAAAADQMPSPEPALALPVPPKNAIEELHAASMPQPQPQPELQSAPVQSEFDPFAQYAKEEAEVEAPHIEPVSGAHGGLEEAASGLEDVPTSSARAGTENALEPAPVDAVSASIAGSLEDNLRQMVQPIVRSWLDENMPRILEEAVREELAPAIAKQPSTKS